MMQKNGIDFINPIITLVLISLLTLVSPKVFSEQTSLVRYDVDFKYRNTICVVSVNGIKAITEHPYRSPVPTMGGLTVSAFLENGINSVTLDMAALSDKGKDSHYQPDEFCQLEVSKIIINEESRDEIELFKLVGSVDENLQPTGKTSPDYDENSITEQFIESTGFYQITKSFEVSGLPEWTWVKATPFEPTEENMQKLRQAYLEVWQTINTKNEEKFQELSHISFIESSAAAFYPGSWYKSLGFDKDFKRSVGAIPINWDEHKLVILNKGRLVKLENDKERSPLGFKNSEGKLISTYNPYFSLIDGSMIITR